ncbi:DarT1-associated NADAR antitoxin family protein [Ileibacterium valens]|uniref:DarT1-associated NADAR antitoxin family protein n=1 Tax=Ileibacterium valens TaxID=1862668 RepID=UPI00259AF84C|nr:hypothetical protein [Ileibacterium valens]
MAERPVFLPKASYPYFKEVVVSFHYSAGFALIQRQKNIAAIHKAYLQLNPQAQILEASSKSPTEFGKSLSPFYLKGKLDDDFYPVENIFQSSKVFQTGGPFLQILTMDPIKAKTTSLTKTHGALLYYVYENKSYPIEPRGWLYDWIYLHALDSKPELSDQLSHYDAFTDIAFNPKTGATCQAKCLAIYLGLQKKNLLQEALASIPSFLKILFHTEWPVSIQDDK